MALDTRDRVLDTLATQGAPEAAVAAVRSLLVDEDEIDAARYQPQRSAELKRERRAKAVGEIATELARLDRQIATSAAEADAERRAADRERVVNTNGHAVDPHRFTMAATAGEVVVLLRDAEAADADTLRRVWAYAEPRLRAMAMADQRQHRVPSGASAFTALVAWQARMKSLAHATPDRSQLADVVATRQREVRQRVLAVARVAGLDAEVEAALKRAAVTAARVGEQPAGKFTVGKFWDVHPQTRR